MRTKATSFLPLGALLFTSLTPTMNLGGEALAQVADDSPISADSVTITYIGADGTYRAEVALRGDDSGQVDSVEIRFEEPFEGPPPFDSDLRLNRPPGSDTFTNESLQFQDLALGFPYSGVVTLFDKAGSAIGAPQEFFITVGEEVDPYPDATDVIEGDVDGDIKVKDGDYVVITGSISNDVVVNGGVLLVQGGVIGRDLIQKGGLVVIEEGGVVGRNYRVKGGEAELSDAWVTRDLIARGGAIAIGSLQVDRDLIVNGDVALITGDDSITTVTRDTALTSGFGVNVAGILTSGRDISLDSISTTTINGSLTAGDDITLRSDGEGLIISGSVEAVGEISAIASVGGITHSGRIDALDSVLLRTDGDGLLDVSGPISAVGDVTLKNARGGSLIVNDVINAEGNVDMLANNGGSLIVNDVINAEGDVGYRVSGGSATIGDRAKVVAKRHRAILEDGNLTVGGLAVVTALQGAEFNIKGGDILFTDSATLSLGDSGFSVNGGDLNLSGSASLDVGASSTRISGGDLQISDSARVVFQDDSDITVTGGNLRADSGNSITAQALKVRVKSNEGGEGGDIWMNRVKLNADGELDFDADGSLSLMAPMTAGGDISLASQGAEGLSVDGPVSAGGDLNLSTQSGSLVVNDIITADSEILMTGSGLEGIIINGEVKSQDILRIRPSGEANVTVSAEGHIESQSDIIIVGKEDQGLGDIIIKGNLTSGGDVRIGATSLVAFAGAGFSGGDIRITSRGNGESTIDGTLTAIGDVDLRGDGGNAFKVGGVVKAGGDLGVNWEGRVPTTIDGTLQSEGDVLLRGDGPGDLVLTGTVAAEGVVSYRLSGGGAIVGTTVAGTSAHFRVGDLCVLSGTVKWGQASYSFDPAIEVTSGSADFRSGEDLPRVEWIQG